MHETDSWRMEESERMLLQSYKTDKFFDQDTGANGNLTSVKIVT